MFARIARRSHWLVLGTKGKRRQVYKEIKQVKREGLEGKKKKNNGKTRLEIKKRTGQARWFRKVEAE